MTRPGCTCPSCSPDSGTTVRGGGEVRCPRGHDHVALTHGRDRRGLFLQARCLEAACGAQQLVRRADA